MTPFGAYIRQLRQERNITLTKMAADLGVSAAYLSAMEHGQRSRPTPGLVRQICGYLNIIWDDADAMMDLAKKSRPKVVVNTAGLTPKATALANLLSSRISDLSEPLLDEIFQLIEQAPRRPRG